MNEKYILEINERVGAKLNRGSDSVQRLVRPSRQGQWWWLPAYAIQEGKGHLPQYWTVISAGPDTEKEGEFVGPMPPPIWTNASRQESPAGEGQP